MTAHQRITLMADWWPAACKAQGWKASDRALRLRVLSQAVGRELASASELNSTTDIDRVKAHLGMLRDNVAATIEVLADGQPGKARRWVWLIHQQMHKLAKLLDGTDRAEAYVDAIINDKFNRAQRLIQTPQIEDLSLEQQEQLLITIKERVRKLVLADGHREELVEEPF